MNLVVKTLLFSKFFALSCVAFMSSAQAVGLPCHVEVLETTHCEACILSLEVWSEPLVEPETVVIKVKGEVVAGPPDFVSEKGLQSPLEIVIRPPPKVITLWRGEEIFQKHIKLRL